MSDAAAQVPTAGLVVVGNEILSGKVTDTNAPFLARELNFLGIDLRRITTVPDEYEEIGGTVHAFAEAYTWVFTSGGVGPTHDDITIAAIARAFGVAVVRAGEIERAIRRHYGDRLTDEHLLMAQVPEGAELIEVPELRHPQVRFRNVFIMPGVPQLFQWKFSAIKPLFRGEPMALRELFLRADEGQIAATLRETAERFPDVLIGSYPDFFRDDYSVKVTLECRRRDVLDAAMAHLQPRLERMAVTIVRVT